MEVRGYLHAPAPLSMGKESLIPIQWEVRWAPEPVWAFWIRDKAFTPSGFRTPYHSASTVVSVPTAVGHKASEIRIGPKYSLYMLTGVHQLCHSLLLNKGSALKMDAAYCL